MLKKSDKYKNLKKYNLKKVEPIVVLDVSEELKLFDMSIKHKQRICSHMYKAVTRKKSAKTITPLTPVRAYKEEKEPITQLRNFCKQCPSTEMSRFQERDIRRKIQVEKLEDKYPDLLNEIINETKQEFVRITHQAGVFMKVQTDEERYVLTPYKYLGKTENYAKFISTQKKLKAKWILHYPVIKKLIKKCILGLPYELFQLNFKEIFEFKDFEYELKNIFQDLSLFLDEFYNDIVKIAEASKQTRINYLGACTGLLSVHLSSSVAHSLLHVVNFTASTRPFPYLKIIVTFDGDLSLNPTPEDITNSYYNFIEKIIDKTKTFRVLENHKYPRHEVKYIHLCLTEEFLKSCKDQIANNIKKLYEPVLEYLTTLNQKFCKIYPDVTLETESFSDLLFNEGCAKILYYESYMANVILIPSNEYFEIGQVVIAEYRETLYNGLKSVRNAIFDKLCLQHFWEINDICETFEFINMRANHKALTTEEIIEIGKYITWVKEEHLEVLTERVYSSLENLTKIIQLGFLTEEHIELNSSAVNWLSKIVPVIDHHTNEFDQLKFDAEEKLQKVVEDVTVLIRNVYPLLVILDDMDNITEVRTYLNQISLHMTKIKEIEEQIDWINKEEVCLSFPKSSYTEFEELKNYVYPFYHLLKICLDIQRNLSVWQDGQFDTLNSKKTNEKVSKFHTELIELQKVYRKKLRQAQDENVPIRFKGTIDDPDILNWPAPLKLCGMAIKLVQDFNPSLKVMEIMCNNALRKRHWKEMSELAGFNITPNAGTTLKKLMQIDFQDKLDQYEIISQSATKEQKLLDNLKALQNEWTDIQFQIAEYSVTKSLILIQLNDIQAIIEDHTVKILNMRGSVFVQPHEKDVKDFYENLLKINQTIMNWDIVQNNWVKLLPIFSAEHVKFIVPSECLLFEEIDAIFRKYIELISTNTTVIDVVATTSILDDILFCVGVSEKLNDGLKSYIERVRKHFPRFFFLANDEILDILSKSKNPMKIQNQTMKLFQGIEDLEINEYLEILSMISGKKEIVKFVERINTQMSNGQVEKWLLEVEKQMKATMKNNILESFLNFRNTNLKDCLKRWPQQTIHVLSQIVWTSKITKALNTKNNIRLLMYLQKLESKIEEKVEILKTNDLTNCEKASLKSLIIQDANNKFIVRYLLDNKVNNTEDFKWDAQLKYYFQNGICTVKLMHVLIKYSYEYLGNYDTPILTPMTDRCFRTLIQSFSLNYTGLLFGPSGAGKTETIKCLSEAIGKQFVSFKCTENLSCYTLERLLKGTAFCGAWILLKKLDLISVDILSTISEDISLLLNAIKSYSQIFFLGGTEITLVRSCFIIITKNSENYNKNELPETLKTQLRTITFTCIDFKIVIETLLVSCGFAKSELLSKKIVTVYKMLKEIWENQIAMSFRTIKNLLNECNKFESENEETVVYNAFKSLHSSTMKSDDIELLNNVLKDIFPDDEDLEDNDNEIKKRISQICQNLNLQSSENFMTKVVQVFESIKVNSGIILVGEAFSGKTTILQIVSEIFRATGESVEFQKINQNYMGLKQLFGEIDITSDQWHDGIVSKIFRNFITSKESKRHWLMFDGALDPVWAENLNSVFDRARKLFLQSGEVLILSELTSVIFEVEDLHNASPATVSRCGVIYFDSTTTVTWKDLVTSWISTCNPDWVGGFEEAIVNIMEWYVPACLDFLDNHCVQFCKPGSCTSVKNMLQLIKMTLDQAYDSCSKKDEDAKFISTWVQATLIYCGFWGLGSTLEPCARRRFDEFYKILWKGLNEDHPYPNSLSKLELTIPQDGLLIDYCYIYKMKGVWKFWPDLLKNEKIILSPYMTEFLVPTINTIRYMSIINLHIKYNCPLLIVGPAASGKTILLRDILLNKVNKNEYETVFLNLNINISPSQIQRTILSNLNKRKAGYYTPPKGKTCLIFIDDLHLPGRNYFEVQNSLEIIRQHLDQNMWYDLKTFQAISLNNVNFLSAMQPQNLSTRILRHFSLFSTHELTEDITMRIYTNILFFKWRQIGFPSDIMGIINQIVQATLKIFREIKNHLKPTLIKYFYFFNMYDFSKVIQGFLMLRKETYDANKKVFFKFWLHEIHRVFGDRLLVADEQTWLEEQIKESIQDSFGEDYEEIFNNSQDFYFGSYLDRDSYQEVRRYEEILNKKLLHDLAKVLIEEDESTRKYSRHLVLFEYAMDQLSKICRVLTMPTGNALLIGISGSGRQTLTKIASDIYHQKFFQPNITKDYDISAWNQDVKIVLKEAGCHGRHCVFILAEEDLVNEEVIEDVDFLLKYGDIPDLYNIDEKQNILELTRLSAQGGRRNLDISSSSVFLFFNRRCKENLHVVLCFSPVGTILRKRIQNYRSLIERTNVILFHDWPDEALEKIAKVWIENVSIEANIKEDIIVKFKYFHRYLQNNFKKIITPTDPYLHMVSLFAEQIKIKQIKIEDKIKLYSSGLRKLTAAALQIAAMQKALAEYQPQLEQMTLKAKEMTKEIALETIEVEKASELVRKDETIAHKQAAVAQVLKSDCEADLAQAIPILEDAISALNTLKPSDITLVKSMKNPPDAIKLVMAAVCVIKDVKPDRIPDASTGKKIIDYWGPSKRILGDMNFLQTLKDFDKDHIKPEIMVKIRKDYLPHKDFKPHIVAKASSAAEGLCKWIIAMDMYEKVAKEVAPKKEKLENAEREYAATMKILNEKKEEVARIEEKLADLNAILDDAVEQQQKLQREVDLCNKKLNRAQKLIGGLGGEKVKWTESAEKLENKLKELSGNILLSSALIAYLGRFNDDYRHIILCEWVRYINDSKIPCSDTFSIRETLGSCTVIDEWLSNGLLNDKHFIENGLIQKYSKKYSVLLDPQGKALCWIKNTEKYNHLLTIKLISNKYSLELRDAISFGKPVLIYNISDHIPVSLNNLLCKKMYASNENQYIVLDGEEIEVHQNFRLYLVSNQTQTNFSPELSNKVNVINFSVSIRSVEASLLKIVIKIEKPALKKLKKDITREYRKNNRILKELDRKILNTLSQSEIDILEDEKSIQILDDTKLVVKSIREKEKGLKEKEEQIVEYSKQFSNVSEHASHLYFCVMQLQNINLLYQFSLEWFMSLYFTSVIKAEKSRTVEARCNSLIWTFTHELFCNVTQSLFEEHKLLFSFLLCIKILSSQNEIDKEEYRFLLGKIVDNNQILDIEDNALEEILPKKSWELLCKLDLFKNFRGLKQSVVDNFVIWKKFCEGNDELNLRIPAPWNEYLSFFQKLLIIKIFKPEQICVCIKRFIEFSIGNKFVCYPEFNINGTFNNSYCLSPILLITSPGREPVEPLKYFTKKKMMSTKILSLCMAENKTTVADKFIKQGRNEGLWIFLQNCHLVPKWLDKLDLMIENMEYDTTHENFRLWLGTEPTSKFPINLLQNSLKVVNQTPSSLKKNLLALYKKEKSAQFYEEYPQNSVIFARLLYGLSFFHSLLIERQKFDASGWNLPYICNEVDFNISIQHLQIVINTNGSILEKLTYLIGDCNYCGIIENSWDKRLIMTILNNCLNNNLINGTHFFDDNKVYGLPMKHDQQDYVNYILKLPDDYSCEVFGLHPNAHILQNLRRSESLLKLAQKSFGHIESKNIQNVEEELLLTVDEILKQLPKSIIEPVNAVWPVLQREIVYHNQILDEVKSSTMQLKNILQGKNTVNDNLEYIAYDLKRLEVPLLWKRLSKCYTHNIAEFINNLQKRTVYFQTFLERCNIKNNYWLPGFYFPKALLCALRLRLSKATNIELHEFDFDNKVLALKEENLDDNCFTIDGLFISGATWDLKNDCIGEMVYKKIYSLMPNILFKPLKCSGVNDGRFRCAVFRTVSTLSEFDSNYITSVLFNSLLDDSHWIKRGAKLICYPNVENEIINTSKFKNT